LFSGISADGVYQANGSQSTINDNSENLFLKQVGWDASHWMNLAVTDVRDGKIGSSKEFFSKFIERTNRFSDVLNRGKGRFTKCYYSCIGFCFHYMLKKL
jgi:hypothetical protein